MSGRILPRLLAAAATLAALVAALTAFSGAGFAQGSAAEADYAPQRVSEPTITGSIQVGQTLTANPGSWTSPTAITFSYQWERCNSVGSACANIGGAIGQSYVIQAADAGSTLRIAVTATNSSGSSTATSNNTAAVPGSPTGGPALTHEPTVTGTPAVGQTLTAATGTWTGTAPITFAFQWQRCNSGGAACVDLAGATQQTYTIQATDAGSTLRVIVTATNPTGSSSHASNNTTAVGGGGAPSGAIKLPNGKLSVAAASIALPNRLVIDGVAFQPTRLQTRASFLARFHVSDTRGNVVRGALVYALGLPYSWVTRGTEVSTDQNGWATITITPTRKMPIRRGHALVVFVRARVQGQDVLAGTSTRRLVQITTAG